MGYQSDASTIERTSSAKVSFEEYHSLLRHSPRSLIRRNARARSRYSCSFVFDSGPCLIPPSPVQIPTCPLHLIPMGALDRFMGEKRSKKEKKSRRILQVTWAQCLRL